MLDLWDCSVLLSNKELFVTGPTQVGHHSIYLMAGTMIKFQRYAKEKDFVRVKIFNERHINQDHIFVYGAWRDDIRHVSKIIWDMAIAIEDRSCRVDFLRSRTRSYAEKLVAQNRAQNNQNVQIIVKGFDHHVNGIFRCLLYKVTKIFGKPGLYFIVEILVIYIIFF